MAWEISLVIAFIGAAAILTYLSLALKHKMLSIIFLVGGLAMLLISFNTTGLITTLQGENITATPTLGQIEANTGTGYKVMFWLMIISIIIFIVDTIINSLKQIKGDKTSENEKY